MNLPSENLGENAQNFVLFEVFHSSFFSLSDLYSDVPITQVCLQRFLGAPASSTGAPLILWLLARGGRGRNHHFELKYLNCFECNAFIWNLLDSFFIFWNHLESLGIFGNFLDSFGFFGIFWNFGYFLILRHSFQIFWIHELKPAQVSSSQLRCAQASLGKLRRAQANIQYFL